MSQQPNPIESEGAANGKEFWRTWDAFKNLVPKTKSGQLKVAVEKYLEYKPKQPKTELLDLDEPLYEQVERLFDLRISSSGNDITIRLGGEQMTVEYEAFQILRDSLVLLVQSLLNKARLEELKTVANVETSAAQDNEFSDSYLEGFNAMRRIVENRIDELARLKSKGTETEEEEFDIEDHL